MARYWRQVRVEAEGKKVPVQPGVIGAHVNQALKAYRAKMGRGTVSVIACMVQGEVVRGGVYARNCGSPVKDLS